MFFGKKNKKKCESCGHKVDHSYNFCPYCSNPFIDPKKEEKDFGLLGRNDLVNSQFQNNPAQNFGITDKLISSVFNSLMKNLDKQFQNQFNEMDKDFQNAEIKTFPNGIRIKIEPFNQKPKPKNKIQARRIVTEKQAEKISTLPRAEAKTKVKRLGDRVIYELSTPGVNSVEDIFISKLESGYEVKALGNKKVYVNSIPINLPIGRYSILKDKLLVEFRFSNQENF